MTGVPVTRCPSCGETSFPPRVWCPACGNGELTQAVETMGTVKEVTILRRAIGRSRGLPVAIGTVHMDAGPWVIARIDGISSGERARVLFVERALVAQPA